MDFLSNAEAATVLFRICDDMYIQESEKHLCDAMRSDDDHHAGGGCVCVCLWMSSV